MGTSNRGHPHSLIFIAFAERHFPRFLLTNDVESNTSKRCGLYFKNKLQRESRYKCNGCNIVLNIIIQKGLFKYFLPNFSIIF